MNSKFFHLIGVVSFCVLLLAAFAGKNSHSPAPVDPAAVSAPAEATGSGHQHQHAGESAYDNAEQARLRELSHLEAEQHRRNRAAEQMNSYRRDLQISSRERWSSMLSTNWQTYRILRGRAAESPTGETSCTLCNGRGTLGFCVLCSDHNGKCVTCNGTGKLSADELCPTCLGSGKCYLCLGTGRMTCAFCDDGTISIKGPTPPAMMPVD